ncbi:hypothetical protein [Allorhodopirellula heiligendammensis]|nr:hypothetical protein [Allorhodopirellula heiligendammensis]
MTNRIPDDHAMVTEPATSRLLTIANYSSPRRDRQRNPDKTLHADD